MVVVVVAAAAVVVILARAVVFSISYHPIGHIAIYFFDFHYFGSGAGGGAALVVVVVVAAVVTLAVIVVSLGMILCLQIVRFSCLLKRRYGRTYGPMDGRKQPRIEMRGRI